MGESVVDTWDPPRSLWNPHKIVVFSMPRMPEVQCREASACCEWYGLPGGTPGKLLDQHQESLGKFNF